MNHDNRYHDTFTLGVPVVEIEIPSHKEIIGICVRAGECAAAGTVTETGFFRGGNIHKILHRELNKRVCSDNIGIQSLIQLVVHRIIHFINATPVTFKINQRVYHIKFILLYNIAYGIGCRDGLVILTCRKKE